MGLTQVLTGVSTGYAASPPRPVSTEEETLWGMDGLRLWIDPQAKFEEAGAYLGLTDRKGFKQFGLNSPGAPYTLGGNINGQPTLRFASGALGGLKATGAAVDLAFMLTGAGYTMLSVVKVDMTAGNQKLFEAYNNLVSCFIGTDHKIYVAHNGSLAATSAAVIDGNAHIVMACWDPVSGNVTVQVDGVTKALTGASKPIPDLSTGTVYGIGALAGVNNGRTADYGHTRIFDRSLVRSDYGVARAAELQTHGTKYGIAITV